MAEMHEFDAPIDNCNIKLVPERDLTLSLVI